ncbi:MAG: glycosyltransferase family 4 protein [Cyanobacteriota bacterium]|jgi:glycosyltransferase involved in cell wall biosynthesis
MRILLVNDYGTLAGGAEVILFNLRDALRVRGHEVRVFASSAKAGSEANLADDLGFGTTGRWRTVVQSANPAAAWALRSAVARFSPDVVHVNLYLTQLSPLSLLALGKVPTIYYAMWNRAICPVGNRWLPDGRICTVRPGIACLRAGCLPLHDWLPLRAQLASDRVLGTRFSRVVAISHAVAARLAAFGPPQLRQASVVHPGTALVEPRDALPPTPRVVVAGRLVPEKGIDILVRAFARLAPRHGQSSLVVIGDGPERVRLTRLAHDMGVGERVIFTGKLSSEATLALLRSAWLVCVPSVWEEPFGMIAAEAQMHGVAVVASRCGGLAEIVSDGETGYLVPPSDEEALANRIGMLFSDRALAHELGMRGHSRAMALFDLHGFAGRMERVYCDAIGGAS